MKQLTDRQRHILEMIREAVRQNGYPPTVREIGAAVGLTSPASVQGHLAVLEQKGFIRRGQAKRRALEVVGEPEAAAAFGAPGIVPHTLPLLGRVAAGRPLLAEEDVEDRIDLPGFFSCDERSFLLRVTGSSMIEAGIFDGDVVVVRRQESAENGDIVVALLGDEATLKRFYRESDHVRLQPENAAMQPIRVREPRIAGKVLGVMRRL